MAHSGLNEWQQKAVETTEGRVLILAGAGSGKTTVLTKRIAHLIDIGVSPNAILGLTFTNKAAKEMSHRLESLVKPSIAKKITISTFHSFALAILRKEASSIGLLPNFTIADRQDVLRHLQFIVRDILEHDTSEIPSLQCLLDDIATVKNRAISMKEVAQKRGGTWYVTFAEDVFQRLNSSFLTYNMVDFDHMLWLLHELFEKHPDVSKRYSQYFQYVMIDEYQDTNPIQAKIAMALAKESNNLCVVGDDDQSIYSWRGAEIANILCFKADSVITLEQNFRSTAVILQAANSVIQMNQERHEKSLWSHKESGSLIELFVAPTEVCEAEAVVSRILKIREKEKLPWSDFAILYRSNSLSQVIEAELLKARYIDSGAFHQGIPYRVYGGDELYEHKEVKDLLSYMKVALNPYDVMAFTRSVNYPRRGVGEVAINYIKKIASESDLPIFIAVKNIIENSALQKELSKNALIGLRQYIEAIESFIDTLSSSSLLSDSVRQLAVTIQLERAIFSEMKSEAMRKWKKERLEQFFSTLSAFDTTSSENGMVIDPIERLHRAVSSFQLQEENRGVSARLSSQDHSEDSISLMTFHGAKGLEFRVCFLIGIEDGLIPHEKSLLDRGLEEERRLMYVALTRAKEQLCISMAMRRKKMGVEENARPSRFVHDIPKECLRVTHWKTKGV